MVSKLLLKWLRNRTYFSTLQKNLKAKANLVLQILSLSQSPRGEEPKATLGF